MVVVSFLGYVYAGDMLVVTGVVLDRDTGKPISSAIVYAGKVGPGYERVRTDANGEYALRLPEDQNAIGVYKKGYYRFVKYMKKTGESKYNFELQRHDIPPEEINLMGRVIEQVTILDKYAGESRSVKIKNDLGQTFYIFDELGSNDIFIFRKWIDRVVRIKGYRDMGKVGRGYEDAEGIYVESIEALY